MFWGGCPRAIERELGLLSSCFAAGRVAKLNLNLVLKYPQRIRSHVLFYPEEPSPPPRASMLGNDQQLDESVETTSTVKPRTAMTRLPVVGYICCTLIETAIIRRALSRRRRCSVASCRVFRE